MNAIKVKDAGSALLKAKDFKGAAAKYAEALDALDDATDTEGKQPVWAACQLNIAQAQLSLAGWNRAVAACDKVIDSR